MTERLYGTRGWTILGAGAVVAFVLFPVFNLAVPAGHPLHLSNFWVTLAGTVYAALTLGFANKFLEAWSGAVIAKIVVLVFIIIFIQRRPQGLFALKGRAAEA